ncbi:hypothetical protein LTR78_007575 [Recurvomyces mirabilis]|uniref:ADP-ribosylation factor n=1 Tax=Recurvomyces mirabilis TaxID=574656 RepID=A0AAE0TSG7_9PEZI|nr:hypothetical protein LTR78_007575 [Recurvomyces mirabilis]KAK5159913.1 hypothetical protein LTS14_002019 [Recurvomyces mirabilis]
MDDTTLTSMEGYYMAIDDTHIHDSLQDLDDPTSLKRMLNIAKSSTAATFVLDFNDEAAYATFDLPFASTSKLLDAERPDASYARWVNLWRPFEQQAILEVLARRYDSVARGNLYRIIDDLWHYSSVDLGRSYVCIGYNSIFGTKHADSEDDNGILPHCTRIWTWLVLCDDSTVITINEDPFPFAGGVLSGTQQRILQETRRNLLNVFRSLSRVVEDERMSRNPMALLPIRTRLGDTIEETAHREPDAPGLLFYYIFENWYNSYILVTRKESRYGVELVSLRAQMFKSPKLCHIDRLDCIGKELGVLKRHYLSYNRIIDRLLEPQVATPASLQGSHVISETSELSSLSTVRPMVTEKESLLGVSFTSAARSRFRRLKDLIDLYALSEVEEYLKQKDSLVTMNFNLIAMKESLDMERLTKITLLITKATISFLPVSLMSAYFSVQFDGIDYTVKEYWVSFAVILAMSWVMLFVFGVASGSVETVGVLQKVWQGSRQAWTSLTSRA